MTREEIIELLIEDRINEWVHARCYDGLKEILYAGWTGYTSYTDQELQEAFMDLLDENFDDEKAEKIELEQLRIRQEEKKSNK
jgi:hypothetical protein